MPDRSSLDCLILCAGKGERLRPLTDVCPKPLLPLCGMAMADHALLACEGLGPVRRMANAHHLPEQILAWAEARHLDHVQVEPELLDTGGALGLLAYEAELHGEHLLVHNGDIVHDIDLTEPWRVHQASGAAATLVVVDRPRVNTVIESDGHFGGVIGHPRCPAARPDNFCRATFTGIAFYRTRHLGGAPDRPWSVKELWHDFLEKGLTVRVWKAPATARWDDLGTADDLGRAVQDELRIRGLSRRIDPGAEVSPDAVVGEGCAVEFGARVEAGAVLRNTVVFPGGEAKSGQILANLLRNPGGDLPWTPRAP
jgi:mannose-1-phosphate guanylyltransferase